jgi:hypothetical protein
MTAEDVVDAHDPAGMAAWLDKRAEENRRVAELPPSKWPQRPELLKHLSFRFEQAAALVRRLDSLLSIAQDRNAEHCAEVQRLERENERMRRYLAGGTAETPAEPTLESFDMRASYDAAKGLEATATFKGDAVKEWCKIAVDWFRETGGKNFVVMDMTDPRDGEHYTLTVQRAGGKTAAQEIGELKAQLAALQPETKAPRGIGGTDCVYGNPTCPQCHQTMPAGDAVHTDYCPAVKAGG